MPVVAAFNSKGGSAKSTAILVLADAFSRQGASVSVIDTDPQRSVANWRDHAKSSKILVVEDRDSRSIHKTIKEQTALSASVFIDMAGFTNDMRTPVVSRADLMIVPMQPSPEDARLAALALALIESDEETLRRPIEKKILWALTVPNMITRIERKILKELSLNSVPTFRTHLHKREGYRAMMFEGKPLAEVDQAENNGIPKAIENADQLAAEVAQYFLLKKEAA